MNDEATCRRCGSARVATVQAHCQDMCFVMLNGHERDGYAPGDMGFDGGDDVVFSYCLDCGQMQGEFPIPTTTLERT